MVIKRRLSFDPKSFLAKIGEGRTIDRYRKDQTVFSQGEPAAAVFYIQAAAVFYIQRGKVKVTVLSEQGKEAVVAILGPDEFVGEGCLAGQTQRIATAATMTESVIMRLEKAAIVDVIHKEPAFSEMFIAHLLDRTIRVEADLVDQLFNSSEKRLARLLLLLANFGKEAKPERMIAKISNLGRQRSGEKADLLLRRRLECPSETARPVQNQALGWSGALHCLQNWP
jgi:CRP/FNR family transcriptional regulator, cyclic AMP receptor protein